MSEGPTHFDLTEEEVSPNQQQSPQHSQQRHSPPSSPQDVDHHQNEEIIKDADPDCNRNRHFSIAYPSHGRADRAAA